MGVGELQHSNGEIYGDAPVGWNSRYSP